METSIHERLIENGNHLLKATTIHDIAVAGSLVFRIASMPKSGNSDFVKVPIIIGHLTNNRIEPLTDNEATYLSMFYYVDSKCLVEVSSGTCHEDKQHPVLPELCRRCSCPECSCRDKNQYELDLENLRRMEVMEKRIKALENKFTAPSSRGYF